MIVVSHTSPVRALDHLELLSILGQLYESVLIPPAVEQELRRPRPRFKTITIAEIPKAIVVQPANTQHVEALSRQLQLGEAEAIALAEELAADLLIDERAGRRIALDRGVHITGVVGLLFEARRRRIIPSVSPLLHRLQTELGFYLSANLLRMADVEDQMGG
jgi:predicted nucleic acid-binding protein